MLADIYVKVLVKVGPSAGDESDWELVPSTGLPDWGLTPAELPMLDATLTTFESTGAFSVSFVEDTHEIMYTHDPAKVV